MEMRTVSEGLEWATRFFVSKWILLVICLVVLAAPIFLRDIPAGDEAYYHLRVAEDIKENSLDFNEFPNFGWPFLASILNKLFGTSLEMSFRILLAVFGLLSFILFYYLTKDLGYIRGLSSLFLLLSPGFLYLTSVSNEFSAIIFLSLLGLYLYNNHRVISLLLVLLMPAFSLGSVISLAVLFFYFLKIGRIKEILKYVVAFILGGLIYIPYFVKNGFSLGLEFNKNIVYDFGIGYGIGIFLLILALFGLGELWRNKYEHKVEFLAFIFLLLLSFWYNSALIYLNFMVVVFAAIGFYRLMKRNWSSNLVGWMMVMVFVYGILFSSVSYFNEYKHELPNEDILKGLNFLSNRNEIVFSYYDRGNWILWSGNRNVVDSNYPRNKYKFEDMKRLLFSYAYDEDIWLMDKYNIKYIFIDKWLKERLWSDESGLLFLLKYDKRFSRIYNENNVEIWEYKK